MTDQPVVVPFVVMFYDEAHEVVSAVPAHTLPEAALVIIAENSNGRNWRADVLNVRGTSCFEIAFAALNADRMLQAARQERLVARLRSFHQAERTRREAQTVMHHFGEGF